MTVKDNQHGGKNVTNTDAAELSAMVLGLLIGEARYLVHMREIGEVIQVPEVVSVPYTQLWFLGLINAHGNLYGVTDLGTYLSGESEPLGLKSRILLIATSQKINCGFVVPNLLGIRNLSEFQLEHAGDGELRNGVTHIYRDREDRQWYALDLGSLIREKRFLQIDR
ncbi:chemotaxis protein CheW [Nitrosomonas marina]|uniref:Twitching motility protein PilI n=1 Tax=Nitrosomonas marina TaxID=917 RepID=A0A1H8EN33_9PROT|nr:chemotaxis protein CheW [Nitrosomonas marina]SEN20208.1 twitching motility protein PilI [Nitrosomonas marina]